MLTVEALRRILGLVPHPVEGGYFTETYRSADQIPAAALPAGYAAARAASTAIYYLLTPDTFSAMHRLASDEIFHFYLGDPVEMLHLHPDGTHRIVVIGPDLEAGQRPQLVVPRHTWQGARLLPGGHSRYASSAPRSPPASTTPTTKPPPALTSSLPTPPQGTSSSP